MTQTTLAATTREGRGKGPARQLRMTGQVPAEVYGLGADNQSVSVDAHELDKILHSALGVNSIITLRFDDGAEQMVVARQIVRHPVRSTLTHVDFIRVNADSDVAAKVALRLDGLPEGVRLGGKFEQLRFNVSVACKPAAMPTELVISVAHLGLGKQLHVSDLEAPEGVQFTDPERTLIAQVSVPRGLTTAAR